MRRFPPLAVALLALFAARTALPQVAEPPADGVAREVKAAVDAHLKALNAGDTNALAAVMHPLSPYAKLYAQTTAQTASRGGRKTELAYFRLLAVDEPYAVARIVLLVASATSTNAAPFMQADSLAVYRRDGDAWKQWTTAPLSTTRTGDAAPAAAPAAPRTP